jgi:hypothetical protein
MANQKGVLRLQKGGYSDGSATGVALYGGE